MWFCRSESNKIALMKSTSKTQGWPMMRTLINWRSLLKIPQMQSKQYPFSRIRSNLSKLQRRKIWIWAGSKAQGAAKMGEAAHAANKSARWALALRGLLQGSSRCLPRNWLWAIMTVSRYLKIRKEGRIRRKLREHLIWHLNHKFKKG